MYKILGVLCVVALSSAMAQTQEELAQFVARQQTIGALGGQAPARRQAYFLPQGKSALQASPQQQVYSQSKANAYQVAGAESQQYYQPQQQQAPSPQYYQPQQYQQPQGAPARKLIRPEPKEEEIVEPPADYQFGFNVKDDQFTNYQKRKEQREGNKITGSYSVVDSDGFIRTVTYTADPIEGFKADVRREPTDIKIRIPQPQQVPAGGQDQPQQQYQPEAGLARKQQTQQYLQAAQPQQQQYSLRPEQTQAYSGAPQGYSPYQQYQQ